MKMQVMSEINTTPLVDIMLVLLIIFLITSPVVLKLQKIQAAFRNQPGCQDQAGRRQHRRQQRRRHVLEPEAPADTTNCSSS
jgi:biopolymer transport protein ExbD